MKVAVHIVDGVGDTSYWTTEERLAMTPEERQSHSFGSKWFMVGWFTYVIVIWILKFNMLCLYQRVVAGVWVEKFIKPAMALVAVSGLAMCVLFFVGCHPFNKLWQVLPDPGRKYMLMLAYCCPLLICALAYCWPQSPIFLVTVLVLNLLTDLCIMLIPAPVIIPLKTTKPRKIGLLLLFGGGTFVMLAAMLRVYYVLAQRAGRTAAIWSCRETLIAIIVGQATMIRSLFTRRFWTGQTSASSSYTYPSKPGQGSNKIRLSEQSRESGFRAAFKPKDPYNVSVLETKNESEEHIIEKDGNTHTSSDKLEEAQGQHSTASSGETSRFPQNTINMVRTIDVESIGDSEIEDLEGQKPNYGHNSKIRSRWNGF